jgi:hypothetical protein
VAHRNVYYVTYTYVILKCNLPASARVFTIMVMYVYSGVIAVSHWPNAVHSCKMAAQKLLPWHIGRSRFLSCDLEHWPVKISVLWFGTYKNLDSFLHPKSYDLQLIYWLSTYTSEFNRFLQITLIVIRPWRSGHFVTTSSIILSRHSSKVLLQNYWLY